MKSWIIGIGVVTILAVVGGSTFFVLKKNETQQLFSSPTPTLAPVLPTPIPPPYKTSTALLAPPAVQTFSTQDIPGAHKNFQFTADIPTAWQAEAVSTTQAIALFDPNASGNSNLEKSKIFIRFFSANQFLTLSTVTINNQSSLQINGRPAIRYDIAKKPSIPNFPGQPSWRNERHIVTDIRVSDANPSIFYVIAKHPDLDENIYEQFLQSLRITDAQTSALVAPIAEFRQRVTKKPFGIYIDPKTSPVQPEKFAGFHTGVDVEYEDVADNVPVIAIADGTVVLSKQASGYGGVVAIKHSIQGKEVIAIYGHLDQTSLPRTGATVKTEQQIGILGDGGTPETDGERKHLHFGIHTGDNIDISGYVQSQEELSAWLNPLEVIGQ